MKQPYLFLVLILGTLSAFGPFVIDLYLPALPQLSIFFHSSASFIQLSLTTAMLGLAFGQLVIGPLSDQYGRKKPLFISLLIYIVSTVLIIPCKNIEIFIFLRLVQGFTAAGGVVLSRAIATDLYHGKEMTRFFAMLITVNGMAPIFSPMLGSFLLKYTDWRGIFITLSIIGIILFIACFFLAESLPVEKRLSHKKIINIAVFKKIFLIRRFRSLVFMQSFSFSGMFAYISASPFIFQEYYQLTPTVFSLCFGLNGAGLVLGSQISGKYIPQKKAITVSTIGTLLLACYLSFALCLRIPVAFLELGFFLLLWLIGIGLPALSSSAMDSAREYAGSASALLGFFTFIVGAIVSPLVGLGDIFSPTAFMILGANAIVFALYWRARPYIY